MPVAIKFDDQYVEIARKFVTALEKKDHKEANNLLNELNNSNHSVIFQEIGKLTRELHDTLSSFELDMNIADLAENEIPDAKKRLAYVIEQTDEAANTTLSIVEKFIPICETLDKDSNELAIEWNRFVSKEMNADDFRDLTKRIKKYIDDNKSSYTDIKSGINEIILAQGFQDITGQIIRKVIALVQDVEEKLIRVIKITGAGAVDSRPAEKDELEGPQVPSLKSNDAVNGQDEVDDLLSSLGF